MNQIRANSAPYSSRRTGEPWRIVFLLENLEYGGTQSQLLELLPRLDPAKFETRLWLLSEEGGLLSDALARGLKVTALSSTSGPVSVAGLYRQLLTSRPDMLVPFTVVPNIWGRVMGRLARVPRILGNCRGGGAVRRQHERYLWRLADGVCANSSALASELRAVGVPAGRIHLTPNGIDTHRFRPVHRRAQNKNGTHEPVFLNVGRLVEDKDQATLLRAFSSLRRLPGTPSCRLRIVGEGPLEGRLKRLAAELGVTDSVEFCPPCDRAEKLYQDVDAFVLSSVREGMPNVVLEAMASGLPVLATSVGGVPELVLHEETGLLCSPASPGEMATEMERLFRPELRLDLGASARRYAESFSLECMAETYSGAMLSVLDRGTA